MRIHIACLAVLVVLAGMTGCAGPEKKLGRGIRNFTEIGRMGEMNREIEQTALWEEPETAYTTGAIRGLNKSLLRTGLGLYEIATFPFPSYEPKLTHKVKPGVLYPDSYRPNLIEDSIFSPDTSLGFAGGDVAPFVPGSRFRIFDN